MRASKGQREGDKPYRWNGEVAGAMRGDSSLESQPSRPSQLPSVFNPGDPCPDPAPAARKVGTKVRFFCLPNLKWHDGEGLGKMSDGRNSGELCESQVMNMNTWKRG